MKHTRVLFFTYALCSEWQNRKKTCLYIQDGRKGKKIICLHFSVLCRSSSYSVQKVRRNTRSTCTSRIFRTLAKIIFTGNEILNKIHSNL